MGPLPKVEFLSVSRLRPIPKAEDRLARGFLIASCIPAPLALMGWLVALFSYLSNDAWTKLADWAFLVGITSSTFAVTFLLLSWLYRKRLIHWHYSGDWVVGE